MHVFPQLRKLEQKYAAELVVVGVHSAKFTSERDTDNLRKAVLRFELEHPVVNDGDFSIWREYGCRAWPTLMFVDPQGKVIGKHEGEISFEQFDVLFGRMVQEFDEKGLLDRTARLDFQREVRESPGLSFPGKILADETSGRLFVADSNNNRIVAADMDGLVLQTIGSGQQGLADGGFGSAQFDHPQGMALSEHGNVLYVADTENHAIRKVDLAAETVETIAGTGEQAQGRSGGGPALQTALSSPWDVVLHDGVVHIAMAGVHQLWALYLETGQVGVYAGNGREAPVDGPLLSASLDQPTGITSDEQRLYFADSEASAVRYADLDPSGRVGTIVGEDLFVWGDVDGIGEQVRLQHVQGVDWHDGVLYIADTYNNKIKRVYPGTRSVLTFLGSGEHGHKDGPAFEARFHEPSGVSAAGGKLYVADTNNHAIRVASLETGHVETLELRGL